MMASEWFALGGLRLKLALLERTSLLRPIFEAEWADPVDW